MAFSFLKKDRPKSWGVHARVSYLESDRYFPALSQKRLEHFSSRSEASNICRRVYAHDSAIWEKRRFVKVNAVQSPTKFLQR